MPAVEYNVNLSLTGAGAEQAVAQLRALQAQFAQTATTGAAMSGAMIRTTTNVGTLSAGTRALRAEVRAMSGAMTLAGMTAFPQFATGAMIAQQAMRGLKIAAAETGMSLAALTAGTVAGMAGLYQIGVFIKENIGVWQATNAEEASQTAAFETAALQMRRTYELAITAVTEGRMKLTEEEGKWMDNLMAHPTPERAALLQGFVHRQLPAGNFMSDQDKSRQVRSEMDALRLSQEYSRTQVEFLNRTIPLEARRLTIQTEFEDNSRAINSLLEREMMTEETASTMRTRSDIERMDGLIQLRGQLTDVQQLAREVAEDFSSGMSSAIVEGFRTGHFAMKQFFSDLLASIAKAAINMAIMRALFGATGVSSGTGGLIGGLINGAASGGFFPQYAANGLAGVSSVSRPTYYPKFNTVAGEAGREMLTVLARPRMMSIGGMQAVVGNAGGQRLAITSADQLGGGGAGGRLVIEVRHSEAAAASIIHNSVERSVVRVTQEAGRATALRQAIKRA